MSPDPEYLKNLVQIDDDGNIYNDTGRLSCGNIHWNVSHACTF